MSKKKLQIDGITNELEGASLFFTKQPDPEALPPTPETAKTVILSPVPEDQVEFIKTEPVKASNHERMNARMHALKHSRMHANTHDKIIASIDADLENDLTETIRKSVKQVGKEEFYMRLTPAEKSEVAKVVFTFNELSVGEGKKISANDIGRIALHHLLIDYHENGEKSILVRVLAALNA
jgi:hypothetical protein